MLLPNKVKVPVGTIIKPHGIRGELNIQLSDLAEPERDFTPNSCLIVEIEGLDVPFFVGAIRPRGTDSLLLTLDEINNEKTAQQLQGLTLYVYASPDELDNEGDITAGHMTGYTVLTPEGNSISKVADIVELTPNCWYFELEDGRLLPIVDEMIADINPEARTLTMTLPEGLLDL